MELFLQILFGLIAVVLVTYMLYRAFWRAPSPEEGASSGMHGGGHTKDRPDATGDPGSPSAE